MEKRVLVAPSVLSADFLNLHKEIMDIESAGCDYIHIDVMDGHFVPNLTIGPVVVEKIAKIATKPLDIHLMVQNVEFFVDLFLPLKPEYLSVHLEEVKHLHRLVTHIKNSGVKAGVVLNPHTHISLLEYILKDIDLVLLMSVNPGFGGQKFIPLVIDKIAKLKEMRDRLNPNCKIEVDGGVSDKNIAQLAESGVDIVVAGSYVFGSKNYKLSIDSLKISK